MNIRANLSIAWLGGLAMVAACTPEPAVEEGSPQLPVVVYAAYEDKTYLPALFNEFTQKTGIIVVVRNGRVPGIVDDVIGDRVSPPADILVTPSASGVWRVAEEGELRPNYSAVVSTNAPAWLQDPDKYWLAVSYRNAVFVYDPEHLVADDLSAYEDLADAKFRRKLCLSSSKLSINRTVIAMLMQKLGPRNAELAVRSWVANLAQPVFDTEEELLLAIESGDCAVGIVSSDVAAAATNLGVQTPAEVYSDIEGIGVTRHARNPEAAVALIDWWLNKTVQTRHASQMSSLPVVNEAQGAHKIVVAAANDEAATKLAERARYR